MTNRVLVVVVLIAGCLEARLVPCGDQLCPSGTTCVAGELCASSDQLTACDGIADGETCLAGGGVGRCDRGVCIATGCGNGTMEIGESCDDGNTTSGDGCRADCQKLEVCGDAALDDGEACDDGNANPADGCDACVATTWQARALVGGGTSATSVGLTPGALAIDLRGNVFIAAGDDPLASGVTDHRIRRLDASGALTTIAGSGEAGFGGDGGPAARALLARPKGVAVDGVGNVYIADTENDRVRRVDPLGIITTVAGNGTFGFAGDGGLATAAQLNRPWGIAVDGLGTLYIADRGNCRIRRVDTSGVITTIAGTATCGFGGDGGPATAAQLTGVIGVTFHAGDLYIADTTRIRRIDATGTITTIAGTGVGSSTGDGGPATAATMRVSSRPTFDAAGNLYFADGDRIRRIDTSGIITTIAGSTFGFAGDGGPATNARFEAPEGVVPGPGGTLLIADTYNQRLRQIDNTGIITTIAGNGNLGFGGDGGAAKTAQLLYPTRLAFDPLGRLYVADPDSHRIRRVDSLGVITTVAGSGVLGFSGDGGAATSAAMRFPNGIAFDGQGNLYIADTNNHRVRRVDAATGIITTIAGTGVGGGTGDGGPATSAQLYWPFGVAVDAQGNVYIADSNNDRIRRVDPNGVITTVAGGGTGGDGSPATAASLWDPRDVALDAAGNLYISEWNGCVMRVDAAGIISTFAGCGTDDPGDGGPATSAAMAPSQLAFDAQGNLYIADAGYSRVRRVDANGVITTIGGKGTYDFSGDGGPAVDADVYSPRGVAIDGQGNVFIADTNNLVVRRIDAGGTITSVIGLIDPEGLGPLAGAHLADPRAIVVTPAFTLVAGGLSGTVQAIRSVPGTLEAVVGRYPQQVATAALARFRTDGFGTVEGVAHDATTNTIYLTESSANRVLAVTVVDPADQHTWTIATLANTAGTAGFADGAAASARFRGPTGLYFDPIERQLYVADTGNHVIRAIDVSSGTVRTVAGVPATRGMYGDGGVATAALLHEPHAITRCTNGDLFVADTGNHRVRRVAAGTNTITTVLGDGVATSSGEGQPASTFPVDSPLALGCDEIGNLYVTSTTAVRLAPASSTGIVDGSGAVQTIYGAPPRTSFPASVTTCLTGLAVIDTATVHVADACTGLLVELHREPQP